MKYILEEDIELVEKFILCEDDESEIDSTKNYSEIDNPLLETTLPSIIAKLQDPSDDTKGLKPFVAGLLDSSDIIKSLAAQKSAILSAAKNVNNKTDGTGSYSDLLGKITAYCDTFEKQIIKKKYKNHSSISKLVQSVREARKTIEPGTNTSEAQKIRNHLISTFDKLSAGIEEYFNTNIVGVRRSSLEELASDIDSCLTACNKVRSLAKLSVRTRTKDDYASNIANISAAETTLKATITTKADLDKTISIVKRITEELTSIDSLNAQIIAERNNKDKSKAAGEWAKKASSWQDRLNKLTQPEARKALWDEYFSQPMWSGCEAMIKAIKPVLQDEILKKGWTVESNSFVAYLQLAKANNALRSAINYDGYASIHNAYASSNGQRISNADLRGNGKLGRDNFIFKPAFYKSTSWSKYLELQASLLKYVGKKINSEYGLYANGDTFNDVAGFFKKYFLNGENEIRSVAFITETMQNAFEDFGSKKAADDSTISNIVKIVNNADDAKQLIDYIAFKTLPLAEFAAVKKAYKETRGKMFIDLSDTTVLSRILTGISIDELEFSKDDVISLVSKFADKFNWTK